MNGKKAKRIRKVIYGDTSLKVKRVYTTSEQLLKDGSPNNTTIINHPDSPRGQYQRMKGVLK